MYLNFLKDPTSINEWQKGKFIFNEEREIENVIYKHRPFASGLSMF